MPSLLKFDFSHFRGDLLGGITAGIVALPLSLAFGVSSGLGPTAGLYGAIFIAFFAALFGGTPTQISGPTAPMTAVSMVVVASIVAGFDGSLEQALPAILTVFLIGGLLQVGIGLLGLGTYIKYIPYPVVSGFMTAIGVIILITQLLPALGYYPSEDPAFLAQFQPRAEEVMLEKILADETDGGMLVLGHLEETVARARGISSEDVALESRALAKSAASGVIGTLRVLPRALQSIDWLELLLTLVTVAIVYGFKRVTTLIPSQLVALVAVTVGALALGLDYRPIQEIPSGLPLPNLGIVTEFDLAVVSPYLLTALTLALLGSIDSLLTSVVADNLTKTRHNPNRELVGQGIGNSIAALFGGLPGAGATIRTVVNINAGGKTRLSGMIAGVLLLVVLLALGPVASAIPAAVLAGILVTVGIGVMDYKGLRAIGRMPRAEVLIMFVVLVLSAVWNLVFAVGIGLVLASLLFMKRISDMTARQSILRSYVKEVPWEDETGFPHRLDEEVFIKHINGPLFFGSTSDFQALINQVPATATCVVIRMERMHYVDQSGFFVLEEAVRSLQARGKVVLLTAVPPQPMLIMERNALVPDVIPREQIFPDFQSCLAWVNEHVEDTV